MATLALISNGCSTSPPRPTPRHGGTLYVALGSDPISLNPLVAVDADSARAYAPLFPLLYALRSDLSVQPELASSLPAMTDSGATITVPLRPDAKWSDGMPITADDVVYTVTSEMNAHLDTRAHFQWSPLHAVSSVDTHTVRFSLTHADASFLAHHLVTPVVPQHVYGSIDPSRMSSATASSQPPVSGGPFTFDRRDAGKSITLKANAHYFGGRPHVSSVVDVVTQDTNNVPNLLAEGKVTWANDLPPSVAGSAVITSGVTVLSYADVAFVAVQFNVRAQRVFSDSAVRRAFAFALDHDGIAEKAGGTQAAPAWSDISSASWAYSDSAVTRYAHSAAHARQVLQAAGWSPGPGGVATKSGHPLAAALVYPREDSARAAAAAQIAQQSRAAGFAITTTGLSSAEFAAALSAGNFHAALVAVTVGVDPDDSAVLRSDGSLNTGGYANPALDALIDGELDATPTDTMTLQQVRKPIFDHIMRTVSADLPLYVLWSPRVYSAFSATLGGVAGVGAQLDADRANDFYVDWYLTG